MSNRKPKLFWRLFVAGLLGLMAASTAPAAAQSNPPPGGAGDAQAAPTEDSTDQIIVRYRGGANGPVIAGRSPQLDQLSTAAGQELSGESLSVVRTLDDGSLVLKISNKLPMSRVRLMAARFTAIGTVEFAEPDRMMYPVLTPNDPNFGTQWDMTGVAQSGAYGANVTGAWDITTGASNLVLAIIDTGQLNHADLAGRFVQGYDMINDARIGNDGNARDNDPSDPGDWVTSAEAASGFFVGCSVRDSSWHGTHVAGTIGATGNNGIGIAGINWQSKIQHVRALGKCGGYTSDIADAIRWAAGLSVSGAPANATPARVINMSLGGGGACDTTTQNAINAATGAGAVVVVAAGNSNANAANYSPASCANVITVASTGKAGSRAYYSNFGASVEIAAQGGDKNADAGDTILSTLNTGTTVPVADTYVKYQGTSMATPHVVGVVSLMLSVKPSLTPAQVTQLLQSSATAFPGGSTCITTTCGAGLLNAQAAVIAAQNFVGGSAPSAFNKSAPANGATNRARNSLSLSWASSSGATSYEYCLDTSNNNTCNTSWVNVGAGTSASVSGLARSTLYYWQVRAVNTTGSTLANGGTWWSFRTRN